MYISSPSHCFGSDLTSLWIVPMINTSVCCDYLNGRT